MKKPEIPKIHNEKAIHYSTTNIVRAIVLLKRAYNALTHADDSLECTEMLVMERDIANSKRSIEEAIRTLEKYKE